ncbi:MAG: M23 family metallopeptidase [Hyphomonadaceae bacterium]
MAVLRFFMGVAIGLAMMFIGWVGGAFYPPPAAITDPVAERAPALAARLGIDDLSLDQLRNVLSEEQFVELRREASQLAAAAGEAIIVEHAEAAERSDAIDAPISLPAADAAPLTLEDQLLLCPRMTVSNAPASDANRAVLNYAKVVNVNGVSLAVNPTQGACLSSAFGPRGGRIHRGLDYYSSDGGPISAAAAGVVVERLYRDDYGNMLLLDHGGGVYTRYAHLSSFAPGIVQGAAVEAGQQLGLMGNTAAYQIPVHLHYELLLGDYSNPRASFGLDARSPFDFPPV